VTARSRRHGRTMNQYRQKSAAAIPAGCQMSWTARIHPGSAVGPAGTCLKYGPATHLASTSSSNARTAAPTSAQTLIAGARRTARTEDLPHVRWSRPGCAVAPIAGKVSDRLSVGQAQRVAERRLGPQALELGHERDLEGL